MSNKSISDIKKAIFLEDYRTAETLLKLKIKQNLATPEMYYLHASYSSDILTEREFDQHYLKNICLAAKGKFPPALFALAMIFDMGDYNVKENQALSKRFLRVASLLKHPQAMWLMGEQLIYQENKVPEGIKLIGDAVNLKSQGALQAFSRFYKNGEFGFEKNVELAEYYRLLSETDDVLEI